MRKKMQSLSSVFAIVKRVVIRCSELVRELVVVAEVAEVVDHVVVREAVVAERRVNFAVVAGATNPTRDDSNK